MIKKLIINELERLEIKRDTKGFHYLIEAITYLIDSDQDIISFSTELYPYISGKFKTSDKSVESAIRHAHSIASNKGHAPKMANVEFVYVLRDKIVDKLDKIDPTKLKYVEDQAKTNVTVTLELTCTKCSGTIINSSLKGGIVYAPVCPKCGKPFDSIKITNVDINYNSN